MARVALVCTFLFVVLCAAAGHENGCEAAGCSSGAAGDGGYFHYLGERHATVPFIPAGVTAAGPATRSKGGSLIVAGATGAIGREVVCAAVANANIRRVVALSRRPIPASEWRSVFGAGLDETAAATKLTVQAVDWNRMNLYYSPTSPAGRLDAAVQAAFQGHDYAAMCMATTKKDAGSAEAFRLCDLLYVEAFGKAVMAESRGSIQHFVQISSAGASSTSWFLYLKTKGEADDAIAAMGFPRLTILRPGLLDRGDKARFIEKVGMCVIGGLPVASAGAATVLSLVDPATQAKAFAAGASMPPGVFFLYDSQILAISPKPVKK